MAEVDVDVVARGERARSAAVAGAFTSLGGYTSDFDAENAALDRYLGTEEAAQQARDEAEARAALLCQIHGYGCPTVGVVAKRETPLAFVAPVIAPAATGAALDLAVAFAPFLLPIVPVPTAEDENVDELVMVEGFRPPQKPPNTGTPLADLPLPPNWNDLLDWSLPDGNLWFFPAPVKDPVDARRDPRLGRPVGMPSVGTFADDEVRVTGRRPNPFPANPASPYVSPVAVPDYTLAPFGDPDPSTRPEVNPRPRRGTKRKPGTRFSWLTTPKPNVWNPGVEQLPDVLAQPLPVPRPANPTSPTLPTPVTPTSPAPAPSLPPVAANPDPFFHPGPSLDLDPLTEPSPAPKKADPCNCVEQKTKPDRKKRQPRTLCKRGTYQQTARGIIYHPKETVPCP